MVRFLCTVVFVMSAYVRECLAVFGKLTKKLLHEACWVTKTELTISSAFAATGTATACIRTHFVDLHKEKSCLINFRTIICDLGLCQFQNLSTISLYSNPSTEGVLQKLSLVSIIMSSKNKLAVTLFSINGHLCT